MKPTFKQFNEYVTLRDEELSEEKLNEIFGTFFNKVADAITKTPQQKREEEIKKKLAAKRDDLKAKEEELKKRQEFAKAKAKVEVDRPGYRPSRGTTHPSSASGARAAERDWVQGMATEGVHAHNGIMEYETYKDKKGVTWNDEGYSDAGHNKNDRKATKFYHDVSFKTKDVAKGEGMKWDAKAEKWYHTDAKASAKSKFKRID